MTEHDKTCFSMGYPYLDNLFNADNNYVNGIKVPLYFHLSNNKLQNPRKTIYVYYVINDYINYTSILEIPDFS